VNHKGSIILEQGKGKSGIFPDVSKPTVVLLEVNGGLNEGPYPQQRTIKYVVFF